jgi:hypothetical protein
LIFFTLTLSTIYVSASFFPKVSKVKSQKSKAAVAIVTPSEFCNDENNSVTRSAMDALRSKKKLAS